MIRKIEKALILIIFLYLDWFQYVFGIRQIIIYVSAILLAALLGIEVFKEGKVTISRSSSIIRTYILFGIYALASGLFVATDKNTMLSTLLQYYEYVFICFAIYYISNSEKSIKWVLSILYTSALVCGLQTIFFGRTIRSAAVFVITMGARNNPNTLGIIMAFGIMAIIYDYESIQKHFMVKLASIVIFAYVIILTGSRKAFIAMAVLLSVWSINYIVYTKKSGKEFKTKGIRRVIQNSVVIMGIIAALVYITSSAFTETSMLTKLLLLFTNGGVADSERIPLYQQAFEFFKQHPILGIGYRQYEVLYSGHIYSHSTYAEILSCTGFIGTIIFFSPVILLLFKSFTRCFGKVDKIIYNYRMIFLILATELFLAATQIVVYDLGHMTLFTFLFWEFSQLENSRSMDDSSAINSKSMLLDV